MSKDFDSLWNYDDPARTEKKFRELLPKMKEPGPRAELLTQIARALGLQGKFEEAHAVLDEAAPLAAGSPTAQVRLLLERGRAWNSSGQPETARPLFQSAWEQARAAGLDFYAIDAAHMLAIIAPPEGQIEWNQTALALATASTDRRARSWMGSLYNNLGWAYHERGAYEDALDMFERALAYRMAQDNPAALRIARWCIGRALRSLGRYEEALEVQQNLTAEFAEAGAAEDGYVCEEMGENLLALGRGVEAREHFARAYELLSRDGWMAQHETARLNRLRDLGEEP